MIKIAVIVPVYNTEKYLRECLDSLLIQTYKNFVVFIVDDGSTDTSGRIADEYAKNFTFFKVTHKKNGGVASARNTALDLVTKEKCFDCVFFLDSDDIATPTALETISKGFINNDIDFLCTGYKNLTTKGVVSHKSQHQPIRVTGREIFDFCFGTEKFSDRSSSAFSLFIQNYHFKMDLIHNLRFCNEMKTCEDQDYRFRALLLAKKGLVISDTTILYRNRISSLSHSGFNITDDLQMINSWINIYSQIPDTIKYSLELFAFNCWWTSLRKAAALNKLDDYWQDFTSTLASMRKHFISNVFRTKKAYKRLVLISLGKCFMKFYFKVNNNCVSKRNTDAFE